jgi:CubicO group peptidase (beta-lactamase class C family)
MKYVLIANIAPAGALYSNVRDVAEWLRLNLNGGVHHDRRLLSPAAIRELRTPHVSMNDPNESFDDSPFCRVADCASVAYALGWVTYDYRGARVLTHSGGIDGQSSLIGLLPDHRFGIVLPCQY